MDKTAAFQNQNMTRFKERWAAFITEAGSLDLKKEECLVCFVRVCVNVYAVTHIMSPDICGAYIENGARQ